jgi:2-amino-4-hydroxy-6-hydroxymethyldihydropteridine diphosphokinase
VDRVVAVGIGSNLGDRHSHIEFAQARLTRLLTGARFSSHQTTAPVNVPDQQPPYLNAAAVGTSRASPGELLGALLAIEQERGRERLFPNAARTLDLDLLLVGDVVMDEPGLIVPHPRFRDRLFVLEPLAEVAGWLRDPVTGRTVEELLSTLRGCPPAPPAPVR